MTLSKCLAFPRLTTALVARRLIHISPVTSGHDSIEPWWGPEKAAGRVQVGHGTNGEPNYADRLDYWYPAIRFRKDDDVIKPLREKELGDWKNLSVEEKKLLYRYSYRQTLAEFEAPNGYWKVTVAVALFVMSMATCYSAFLSRYVYPPIPPTFDNEWKEAAVERMLVLEKGQFLGAAPKYDYEKNQWKA
ncbi:Protein W09C5.8 [Aphelenchoides avenae]|nr:Protein W09C5.8 [Aphelenchus avenae]